MTPKRFERIVLIVGIATLALLLWKLDARVVFSLVWQVGWGFLLIIPQEAAAHSLNALGWRLAFAQEHSARYPLLELLKLRVAGDAVNYLTPSGTIAGEIARTALLNDSHGAEVRGASVLVAKFTQALAQMLFTLSGLSAAVWFLPWLAPYSTWIRAAAAAFVCGLGLLGIRELVLARRSGAGRLTPADVSMQGLGAMAGWVRVSFRRHPERFLGSIACFFAAYAWGAFEAYWICRFLGMPVPVRMALLIEVLSIGIDGLLFMVPAKVGTQEGGKTAVFLALGLPARQGLAFGVVRHVRELAWAGLGLWIVSAYRRAESRERRGVEAISSIS